MGLLGMQLPRHLDSLKCQGACTARLSSDTAIKAIKTGDTVETQLLSPSGLIEVPNIWYMHPQTSVCAGCI